MSVRPWVMASTLVWVLWGCESRGAHEAASESAAVLVEGQALPAPTPPGAQAWARASLRCGGQTARLEVYLDASAGRGLLSLEYLGKVFVSGVYPMYGAAFGDVDGDGCEDVLLGIWSTKRRHAEPQPHRTVWLMGYSKQGWSERWRGSALARPLVSFTVAALDEGGGDALLSLEREGGQCVLGSYAWTGFGFVQTATKRASCEGEFRAGGVFCDASSCGRVRLRSGDAGRRRLELERFSGVDGGGDTEGVEGRAKEERR